MTAVMFPHPDSPAMAALVACRSELAREWPGLAPTSVRGQARSYTSSGWPCRDFRMNRNGQVSASLRENLTGSGGMVSAGDTLATGDER